MFFGSVCWLRCCGGLCFPLDAIHWWRLLQGVLYLASKIHCHEGKKKKKKIHCDHSFPISFVVAAFGKLAAALAEVQSGM